VDGVTYRTYLGLVARGENNAFLHAVVYKALILRLKNSGTQNNCSPLLDEVLVENTAITGACYALSAAKILLDHGAFDRWTTTDVLV
jgi:hypothetical protein